MKIKQTCECGGTKEGIIDGSIHVCDSTRQIFIETDSMTIICNFCPQCGKPLEIVEDDERLEEDEKKLYDNRMNIIEEFAITNALVNRLADQLKDEVIRRIELEKKVKELERSNKL